MFRECKSVRRQPVRAPTSHQIVMLHWVTSILHDEFNSHLVSILLVMYDFSGRQLVLSVGGCLCVCLYFSFDLCIFIFLAILSRCLSLSPFDTVDVQFSCFFPYPLFELVAVLPTCSINFRRKQINCNPNKYGKIYTKLSEWAHINKYTHI